MPIGDTVDALLALAGRPRDLLINRTTGLQQQQLAVTNLSALLVSVNYIAKNLGKSSLFDQRTVTTSNTGILTATMVGNPPLGSYQFTPVQTVQSQQLLSQGFADDQASLGGGELTFRFGDHVQRSAQLDLFGGGQGVTRGKIRITDRSGESAEIDLSTVRTVDDVLDAINDAGGVDVTGVAHGDGIRLIDNTGESVSNLKVEEVGSGTTAASLGLAGIDVSDDVADGQDMLWLYEGLDLDVLNDGAGVRTSVGLSEIGFTLRDGTTVGQIDFSYIVAGSSEVVEQVTLGDVVDLINAAEPGKLQAEIAPDGERLVLTDLTTGGGTFTLSALNGLETLADLGLDGQAVDGVITGDRIIAGTRTVLLSSLDGGAGLGGLGTLQLTDRSGATDTVDLSAAETLEEVIDTINAAGVGISAGVNCARNGIELVDTTGSSAFNLIVADADASGTAAQLGIAVDDAVESIASGDLHLQVIAENTRLDDLNGGGGVARGTLIITDSAGDLATLDLSVGDIQTIGDVIDAINALSVEVEARINDTDNGILLIDQAGGEDTLQVWEGDGTTAADLHLLADAKEIDVEGETVQAIDGVFVSGIVSLDDLREAINELGAGVTASTFIDGSSNPYRLSLASDQAGRTGELIVDTSQLGLSMNETAHARDALMVFGDADVPGSNVLVSSSSNTFQNVLSGVNLQIKQPSTSPVTITVGTTNTDLIANVQTMVNNYNQFREKLAELTAYNLEAETKSVLSGDATALRLDVDLSYLLSGRFNVGGAIQSLAELGVDVKDDGTLSFDESQLKEKCAADPQAVEQFFTIDETGFSARFDDLIGRLSDEGSSLLANRIESLGDQIEQNSDRIEFMADRLLVQRNRLLLQFYRMEVAIGKMQAGLAVLQTFQPLAPMTSAPGVNE